MSLKKIKISETEKRVLQSLHLRGCTGSMGSMNLSARRKLLHGLIDKDLIIKDTLLLTEKGIELSSPNFK